MKPRILSSRTVHSGFSTLSIAEVETATGLRYRREIEDHGAAASVLPYDPARKVAMLVRQLRIPMFSVNGAESCLEAPAGLLDESDAEDGARREALEECGLRLGALEPLGQVWPMPGVSTERIDIFLAAYSAQDRVAAGGGLEHEHEEIEVVEMPLADLARMADRGEIADLKTYALVLALRHRRPELF